MRAAADLRGREAAIFLAIALFVVALRLATLHLYPIPEPLVHDEFANMLGAQTFALGRLTNTPALFPDAFLEFHILAEPTRMMKYQPAMAGFMALGIVLFGNAYWGVVICMALAIATGYWALRGWVGQRTALGAAFVLAILFRAPHYWMNSYWGGGPPMLACFLMLGAYARVFNQQRYHFIAIGLLGLVLGFLSRPFETLMFALFLSGYAIYTLTTQMSRTQRWELCRCSLLPIFIILPAYAAFQLYYNYSITAHALTLPYMEYDQQRGMAPLLLGNTAALHFSPHYVLSAMQRWELEAIEQQRHGFPILYSFGLAGVLGFRNVYGIATIAGISMVLFFCIVVPIMVARKKKYSDLCLCWGLMFIPFALGPGWQAHYLAPQFTLLVILIAIWWEEKLSGRKLTASILLALLCVLNIDSSTSPTKENFTPELRRLSIVMLEQQTEKSVVFVDFREQAKRLDFHGAWVYNEPDMESSHIIWAWYMSPEQNQKLIEHYKDRTFWYINPDQRILPIPYDRSPH